MSKRKRTVQLVASVPEDKVWAALVVLGGYDKWVSIDTLGDFLRMRQLDATAVRFDPKDANTRYALEPSVILVTKGWEDPIIAKALSAAMDHGFIEHGRNEELNVFRAIRPDMLNLWKMRTTSTPTRPEWASLRVQHVEQANA